MGLTPRIILDRDKTALTFALGLDGDSARIEVQCLLQAALQVNRAWLLTHPNAILASDQQAVYLKMIQRRMQGEPVAYILGQREFYGLAFKVTPSTLIPRHDTELLVELALQRIPLHTTFRILDLGTGSGAIALSIAHARPDAEIVAVDASVNALEVARENANRLKISNLHLLHSNWYSALQNERFNLIVSNPPYIAAGDRHLDEGDLRFEPHTALIAGLDGLDDIRIITANSMNHLNKQGWLLIEHGYDQSIKVRELLGNAGLNEVFSACDLSGIERVTGGSRIED